MSNSLSAVFSAAEADPVFSIQKCRELDLTVRTKSSELKDLPNFDDARIAVLCRDLNTIADWYLVQSAVGPSRSPQARYGRLTKIEKKAVEILELLGTDPHSPPDDIAIEHLITGGIFEDPSVEFKPLIEGLQAITCHAREAIEALKTSGIEAQHRSADLVRYRLYDDLGAVYKANWGRGSVPVSVNAEKGGPAIRYFEYTLFRIVGDRVKPQAIKDAVDKIKTGAVDLSSQHSVFSPDGDRGI